MVGNIAFIGAFKTARYRKCKPFFDIVLHYLCNENLKNNQPRSRKLKMRYLIPATKPRNIPNSAKASSFGMISSWGKILESIFTNKQSGGKGRGERPWREVEGFQGEEDWGSRRIKSFPLDPDTRQRQITRDLGVLGGSASSHTQRSFPLQAAAMSPRVVVKKMPKLCVPQAQRDQDIMHGRMLLVCHASLCARLINKL